jgi:hypothetical protein
LYWCAQASQKALPGGGILPGNSAVCQAAARHQIDNLSMVCYLSSGSLLDPALESIRSR